MTRPLLVLRPEPGASATAARATARGLEACIAPLFHVEQVPWSPPTAAAFDALMLTSANAARYAGPAMLRFRPLPLYVVGTTTAAAAQAAGLKPRWVGTADAGALLEAANISGVRAILHLCGREYRPTSHEAVQVERRVVYAAEAATSLGEATSQALARDAVVLLHSPRAASVFGSLVDAAGLERRSIALVAISPAAAAVAGGGWQALGVAPHPTDDALLAVAARMCE